MTESIKIVHQINHNECGLCVLKSLIKYHHNKNVEMNELIDKANINENGISIYDLEILAEQYNISLESYKSTVEELIKINKKEKFILVLNECGSLHYVIAQNINDNKIRIYCSKNGVYELDYKELEKVWINIYIKCDKTLINNDFKLSLKTKFELINWKYLLFINFVNVIVVLFTLFTSTIIQQFINKVIDNKDLNNLLSLCVTFFIAFAFQFLSNWFIDLFSRNFTFKLYQQLHNKTIRKLKNKYHSFFDKVDYSYLISIDNYLYDIASFYSIKLNDFISDSLILFSSFILLAIYSWYFILIGSIIIVLIFSIESIKYFWLNQNLNKIKETQNSYLNDYIQLINSLKMNKINFDLDNKIARLKDKFIKVKDQSFNQLKFNSSISFFDNLLFIFFFIVTIAICCNLINKSIIKVSDMILAITILEMQSRSMRELCSLLNCLASLKLNKQIVKNIWNISNINNTTQGQEINNINKINYKNLTLYNDTKISGKSGSGKTTILKTLANIIKTENILKFNDINISLINTEWINNNIFYISDDSYFNHDYIQNLINSNYWNQIIEIIKMMDLKSFDINGLSKGQKQVLAFISLLNFKNKVILIDELLSNVDIKLKNILLEKIKPEIVKNNFLLFVDHNCSSKQFKYEVNLNE